MDFIMVMGYTAMNLVFIYFEFDKDLGCGNGINGIGVFLIVKPTHFVL